jgi:hypothetical protein
MIGSNPMGPGGGAMEPPEEPESDPEPVYLEDEEVEQLRRERMKGARRLMKRSAKRRCKKAKKLARYPVVGSLIGESWREDRWASILVIRRKPDGQRALMSVLIDLGCKGICEWLFRPTISPDEVEEILVEFARNDRMVDISLDSAARILEHGVAWTQKAGLQVDPMYFVAEAFLGDADWEASDEPVPLGMGGKHLYTPSPDEEWEPVADTLRETLGREGFDIVLPEDNPNW